MPEKVIQFGDSASFDVSLIRSRIARIHRLLEAAAFAAEALNQLNQFSDLAEGMARELSRIQRRYAHEQDSLERFRVQINAAERSSKLRQA